MMRLFLLIHVLAVLTALTCSGNCKAGIVISIDHAMAHAGDTILLGVYASSETGDSISGFNLPFDYNSDGFVDSQGDGIGDLPNGFSLAFPALSHIIYSNTDLDRPSPQIQLIGADAIATGTGGDIRLGNSLTPTKLFDLVVVVASNVSVGTVVPFLIKVPNDPFASLFNVAGKDAPTVLLPTQGNPATGSITIVAVPEPTSIFLLLSLVIFVIPAMRLSRFSSRKAV